MAEPAFDNKEQLKRIQAQLIEGEQLHAVWDCKGAGTGFVGVTDRRLIFYDQGAFLQKKAMITIPLNQIRGVATTDTGGILFKSQELVVMAAPGRFVFEFRGEDKGLWTYQYILSQILPQPRPLPPPAAG